MIHVVKLGGSLLDLPDLVERFERWRPRDQTTVVVVGGGDAAELVRAFDRQFALGAERGHWLAVRAMQFNAHVVAAALRTPHVVSAPDQLSGLDGQVAIVDALAWLSREEQERGESVPHRWSFTSDSIAAHVAVVLHAERLTLLKSTLPEGASTAEEVAAEGVVDCDFPAASAAVPRIDLVNLRAQPPATLRLR